MKRSYLLRRPQDEDDDYYTGGSGSSNLIHAKPIDERYAKTLGDAYKGKDFVRGSEKSQQQFYGKQTIVDAPGTNESGEPSNLRPLTHDERNAISAKIIKAELKGNTELVRKLKNKLEFGVTDVEPRTAAEAPTKDDSVLLMKMNQRTGLVEPARSKQLTSQNASEVKKKGTVDYEYNRHIDLRDMVATEKSTSATDQLTMFNQATKMCSENNVDDDWVVDDNIMSHPKKKRHEEKDSRKAGSSRIAAITCPEMSTGRGRNASLLTQGQTDTGFLVK
ncbi:CWF19-like protein 2 like protein [Ditylenchus destructor]|uniref:CWF19-like protein 2 like protein n=1 Tax=Ditylenchus destructor TaxID=166010 RepID=A0AAD4NIE5_9BILA|nr:CWF19-like protein 2 like protein [Ditylenchus destructor]